MSLELFESYFQTEFKDRWSTLKESLLKAERQVARRCIWDQQRNSSSNDLEELDPRLYNCQWFDRSEIQRGQDGLLYEYIMDPGSVLAARSLPIKKGDRVLDMCAAPGGKTLILLEALSEDGELIANDMSSSRRERLTQVIQQYVPRSIRERVWVKGQDAVQFGLKDPESFDAILLDAPCSGERHLLENPSAMQEWSPRRTEHLAARQYALICSALLALKPGGHLLYSTCSISAKENDGVVAKFLKKKKQQVQLVALPKSKLVEQTEFGNIVLPDRQGFGPLYFSLVRKNFE